jgi:hypothetical protein
MKAQRWAEWIVLAVVIPLCLNAIVYFGFLTNYTRVFSRATFETQYESGIYRYRVLGREAVLLADRVVARLLPTQRWASLQAQLVRLDPAASVSFYFAYFAINTLFFTLTIAVLMVVLRAGDQIHRRLLVLLVSFLIALSQYVVTPYDTLAYFLLCAGAYVTLQPPSFVNTLALMILIALGTATRETASLNISFALAVYFLRHGLRLHRDLAIVLCATGAFVATYVALRCWYGFSGWLYDGAAIARSASILDLLVVVLSSCLLWLFSTDRAAGRAIAWLLLCSAPYLALVARFGIWRELRLWVPLILLAAIFAGARPTAAVGRAATTRLRQAARRRMPMPAPAHSSVH